MKLGLFLFCFFFLLMMAPGSMGSGNVAEEFKEAAKFVAQKSRSIPDEYLLVLYGLYKQATEGDADPNKSVSIFDVRGAAKHSAWKENAGMSKEEAMEKYSVYAGKIKREFNWA